MPPIPTSLTDRRIVERNRKLAAAIAAGHSPLDDQIVGTLAAQAAALLDVPGPRVTQLLAELDAARARITELEAEPRVCGATDGQYRCNIHRGHEGCHMTAINDHVVASW